jgi:hypothetical protein
MARNAGTKTGWLIMAQRRFSFFGWAEPVFSAMHYALVSAVFIMVFPLRR